MKKFLVKKLKKHGKMGGKYFFYKCFLFNLHTIDAHLQNFIQILQKMDRSRKLVKLTLPFGKHVKIREILCSCLIIDANAQRLKVEIEFGHIINSSLIIVPRMK